MRFVLAGGGTGGHAYPAIAVAEELRSTPTTELVYYGTPGGPEQEIAALARIPYRPVPASQIRGRSPLRTARGLQQLWRGTRVAEELLDRDRPNAVFATGGYAAAPIGRAASREKVPLVVFLPDAHPGWAVRFLARHATMIACSIPVSLNHLPAKKSVVTGYPVRRQFLEATRSEGLRRFGLDTSLPTLLIAGGSLGAHQINRIVADSLRLLLERTQIIHIAGRDEEFWLARERDRLPAWQQERYRLYAYTEEMAYAMAAADLAITRAGASTLGELPVTGLPAIVIPGGFSDQHRNAAYLAQQGAAIVVSTAEIDTVPPLVLRLLNDEVQRMRMAEAMRSLAQPDAAEQLANLVLEVAA
jgi:UDP-N-acetylglucosamine--N-acetylmuramyl-(pentapeptide) pyrophosphoryl-undecaprenol N-acetylglucosamine transferase